MTRGETIGAATATMIAYLASPDILDKWETALFLAVVFCGCVAAIWAAEEFMKRIRRARRIARRKRVVYDINFSRTGMIEEETGKEVVITS